MNTSHCDNLSLPQEPFSGTFAQVLPLIVKHPALVETAKSRLFRLMIREGFDELRSVEIQRIYGKESLRAYKAMKDFFGVEIPVDSIVTGYLGAACMGAEADKQALLLIGPPGAGKSDQVQQFKRLYRGSEPIPFLSGSPVHDNPLALLYMIPNLARHRAKGRPAETKVLVAQQIDKLGVLELINWDRSEVKAILEKHGVTDKSGKGLSEIRDVEDFVSLITFGLGLPKATRNSIGKPDPFSRERLLAQFKPEKAYENVADFEIESMFFDMDDEGNFGIVDVPEVQPLNFDISTWIGSENLSRMGRVQPDDPRSIDLNGAFDRGNRGIVVLTEGLKNPPEAHRVLLEALQGRRVGIPQPLGGSLHWEGLVIIHSNEGEYNKFLSDKVNEPYWDRFLRVLVPYPLEASEAAKITRKLWSLSDYNRPVSEGGVHMEPILPEYEARLRVLSYIEDDDVVSRMVKLNAYDGKQIRAKGMGTIVDVRDLRKRATWREGMEGISPRDTAKTLGSLAAEKKGRTDCITTRDVRDRVHELLKVNVTDPKRRERLEGFLATELEEWRRKELGRIVRAAFVPEFGKECQDTFDKYVDWSNSAARGVTPRNASGYTRISISEMENFLREIESDPDWGVSSSQAPKFRQEIQAAVSDYMREKGSAKVPYTVHEGIRNCIERFVLKQVKDVVRIFSSTSSRDEEDKKKLTGVKERLIKQHGFCPHCADQLLLEVEMTRDFLVER